MRVCSVLVLIADSVREVSELQIADDAFKLLQDSTHARSRNEELAMRQRVRASSLRFEQVRFEDGVRGFGMWDV